MGLQQRISQQVQGKYGVTDEQVRGHIHWFGLGLGLG